MEGLKEASGSEMGEAALDRIREEAMAFAGIGLYRFRFDGTIVFIDQGALRVFEIEDRYPNPADATGKLLTDLFEYTTIPGSLRREIRERGRIRDREWSFRTFAGREKWVLEDCYLTSDPSSGEECIQILILDITERRQAELALARSARVSNGLHQLMAAMSSCNSVSDALVPLVDTALSLCSMDAGGVYLSDGVNAVLHYHRGLPAHTLSRLKQVEMDHPVLQAILSRREPTQFRDVAPAIANEFAEAGLYYVYATPLCAGSEIFGFLGLAMCRNVAPDPGTYETLSMLAMEIVALFDRLSTEEALRESEAKYRSLIEMLPNALVIFQRGHIVFANEAAGRMIGVSRTEELIGRNTLDGVPERERARLISYSQRRMENDPSVPDHYETVLMRTNGEEFPAEVFVKTILYQEAPAEQLLIIDITDRERSRRAIEESQEKYREILDNIQEGYYEVDLDGNFIFFNKALSHILGYPEADLKGMNYREYYADQASRARAFETYNRVHRTGIPVQAFNWEVLRKDGSKAVLEVSVSLMHAANGEASGFRGIVRDVTQRRQAERALREAEARNRALLNAIPDYMFRIKSDGTVIDFKADLATYPDAWPLEDIVGATVWRVMPEGVAREFMEYAEAALETGRVQSFEFQMPDGDSIGDYEARLVVSGRNEVLAILRDISDRKRSEQALRDSEERYRELFENANDIIYTHDLNGRITSFNQAAQRITGYTHEDALGHNAQELVAPEFIAIVKEMVLRKLKGEEHTSYEVEINGKNGQRIPLEVSTRLIMQDGRPVGVQGIARDITERKGAERERERLEAQIRHAQKLEGLGVLAGGIAHDFNNLLAGILGNAGLALMKLPGDSPARSCVQRIEDTAQRAAVLTNQMLAYSGKGTFVVETINLSKLAQDMGNLLSAAISKKAVLRYNCDPDIPPIEGDPAQLHQVIMNLITNASDALGNDVGVITLTTRVVHADRAYLASTYLNDDLSEGIYVCLEVSDTGCGMHPDTQARIFDPFFSTKFAGRGLGLAAVLGIVRGHHGAIKVYSEPTKGAVFKVLFPIARHVESSYGLNSPAFMPMETLEYQGAGLILVADDEESVRNVAKDTLEHCGFSVVLACDGKQAVDVFEANAEKISAVLLDLTMPLLSGEQAFVEMQRIRPGTIIILCSGYTQQDAISRFEGPQPAAFIQKPYTPRELIFLMQKLLSPTTPAPAIS